MEAKKEKLEEQLAQEREYQKLEEIPSQIKTLTDDLEEKEMRWLELSERG